MIKFVSDVKGAEILLFQEHAVLGPVADLLFSPDNGAVMGLFCFDPIAKRKRIIMTADIKRMTGSRIVAEGYDALVDPADVIRVEQALEVDAKVIKEKVITESGQRLGKVGNVAIDTTSWKIARLYVDTSIGLKFLAKELIIPAQKIIRIEKKQIIVSDEYAKVLVPSTVIVPGQAAE